MDERIKSFLESGEIPGKQQNKGFEQFNQHGIGNYSERAEELKTRSKGILDHIKENLRNCTRNEKLFLLDYLTRELTLFEEELY